MLKNRIIPCLDIDNGRVVKGINFKNLIDAGDPVKQAKFYCDEGADELCLLDITASSDNRETVYNMVKEVAKVCFIPFTVGGGVRNTDNILELLNCGADKVCINSAAIHNPEIVKESSKKFGSQCIVTAVDVKNNGKYYEIYINGGRKPTGINAIDWIKKMEDFGAGEILLTSMDKDGTKSGYDLNLLKIISSSIKIPVIASGGVGNLEHLHEGIKNGASAVLAASIFHFRTHSIKEAKKFLQSKNIPVRIQK
jgi:imidazole glycerol-phosphate synthase subunit HisF